MLLRATDLVVRHHPSMPPVLDRVSIEVARGEVMGVVGGNGSGKSTLARALAGLLDIESGRIEGAGGRPPRVGLVLQDPAAQLVTTTVADELALGPESGSMPRAHVRARVEQVLLRHDLGPLAAREPGRLSGGQQQRTCIAAIDACEVDVLVLDEPGALLDPRARDALAERVRDHASERGVIWITQLPDELEHCDRVVALDAGAVVWQGSISAYVASPHVAHALELELPVAARIAQGLVARGAWPADTPVPTDLAELERRLLAGDVRR